MSGAHLALLFTDVVDSTSVVERLGDEAAAALWAEHDRQARDLLTRHRGREIDRADGFFMLFDAPVDAARFALAYHGALATLKLSARCGVHVGPVTLRDNAPADVARGAKRMEVEGRAKPVAARVMSLAAGGQTLLTEAARLALADELPIGAQVKSHGHYQLKGLDTPIEVFELGRGEQTAFAAPVDADKAYRVVRMGELWLPVREVRHNLPVERDSFFDRNGEMRLLTARLEAGARLLTVIGVGGTGKTRFARRHGWRQLGDWPGGVYFCDLSESRSVDGIVRAVAVALDTPLAATDPVQQVGHAIAGRGRCLIILDNFEQVVEHAQHTLGRWLDRAGDAAFVVTSRERLHLPGEEVVALEPLPTEADAFDLFVDRARAQDPGFAVNDGNRATIGQIVKMLDGLPLAIELAAARVRLLPPAQLLERLNSRFQLLASSRGAGARQATLKATVDWSWQLLTPWEQAALAQCSAFDGGFTLEAAESVIDVSAWPNAPAPLDIVQALIDKSLLRRWTSAVAGRLDEPSFGMYLSIREFAAERLEVFGRAAQDATEFRHGRFYAAFGADAALESLYQHGSVRRRLALTRDLDNLVCACERALRRQDPSTAIPAYRAIAEVMERQGPFSLSASLGARLLALPALESAHRAIVQVTRAKALLRMGQRDDCRAAFDEALALARSLGDRRIEGRSLSGLSWLEENLGHADRAHELAEQAMVVHREGGHPRSEGTALTSLAYFANQRGRLDAARDLYERALEIHRSLGNQYDECGALWRFGVLHAERGDLQKARSHFERALEISERLQDRVVEGEVLTNLAVLHHEIGDPDKAGHLYERALAIHRDVGNRRWEACVLGEIGQLHVLKDRVPDAQRCIEQALAIAREIGDRQVEGGELINLGDLMMRQGRLDEARAPLTAGEAILRTMGNRLHLGLASCSLAELEHRCGHGEDAHRALQTAQQVADLMGLEAEADLRNRIRVVRELIGPAHEPSSESDSARMASATDPKP